MLPFYFLSIATTLIMGLILAFLDRSTKDSNVSSFLRDQTFLLLLTVFSGFTAIAKMISPVGVKLIIVGDLIPVLVGLIGTIVFLNRYLNSLQSPKQLPDFFNILINNEVIIGYICLATAVFHLLFSQAIFL